MPDFWRHSGFHLTEPDARGGCRPAPDLLRAYFGRAEVAPVPGSCDVERALFELLQRDPHAVVDGSTIAAIADEDARENYTVVLRFRDHLVASGTLERAYMSLFVDSLGRPRDFSASGVPPLFASQLAHIIMRNILDGSTDGLLARAGELFFRDQRAHVADGQAILADLETVEMQFAGHGDGSRFGNLGRLITQAQTPLKSVELDVLDRANSDKYWERDELHDTALVVSYGHAGLSSLCRAIELWVRHFFGARVRVEAARQIDAARMRWFVGLDGAATAILNDIYNGLEPSEDARRRILCMMILHFEDDAAVLDAACGMPCHLALAMDEHGKVRMKPQNLLVNLPFRRDA